jgi:hypothetical protein
LAARQCQDSPFAYTRWTRSTYCLQMFEFVFF